MIDVTRRISWQTSSEFPLSTLHISILPDHLGDSQTRHGSTKRERTMGKAVSGGSVTFWASFPMRDKTVSLRESGLTWRRAKITCAQEDVESLLTWLKDTGVIV